MAKKNRPQPRVAKNKKSRIINDPKPEPVPLPKPTVRERLGKFLVDYKFFSIRTLAAFLAVTVFIINRCDDGWRRGKIKDITFEDTVGIDPNSKEWKKDGVKLDSIKSKVDSLPKLNGLRVNNLKTARHLIVYFGDSTFQFDANALVNGIDLIAYTKPGCATENIKLQLIDKRIYVAAEFKDIKTEHSVGGMKFNKWEVYKPEVLNYYSAETNFTVVDKQNWVMFDIICVDSDKNNIVIAIRGYFVSAQAIVVVNQGVVQSNRFNCFSKFDSNWRLFAEAAIEQIKQPFAIPEFSKDSAGSIMASTKTFLQPYPGK